MSFSLWNNSGRKYKPKNPGNCVQNREGVFRKSYECIDIAVFLELCTDLVELCNRWRQYIHLNMKVHIFAKDENMDFF